MAGKRHNRCKLPPFPLKRAKDGKKEYLLNVYSVINGGVFFLFFLSLYLVNQTEFNNQCSFEILEIDSQTLLNMCLQDCCVIGQMGNPRDLSHLGSCQDSVLFVKTVQEG